MEKNNRKYNTNMDLIENKNYINKELKDYIEWFFEPIHGNWHGSRKIRYDEFVKSDSKQIIKILTSLLDQSEQFLYTERDYKIYIEDMELLDEYEKKINLEQETIKNYANQNYKENERLEKLENKKYKGNMLQFNRDELYKLEKRMGLDEGNGKTEIKLSEHEDLFKELDQLVEGHKAYDEIEKKYGTHRAYIWRKERFFKAEKEWTKLRKKIKRNRLHNTVEILSIYIELEIVKELDKVIKPRELPASRYWLNFHPERHRIKVFLLEMIYKLAVGMEDKGKTTEYTKDLAYKILIEALQKATDKMIENEIYLSTNEDQQEFKENQMLTANFLEETEEPIQKKSKEIVIREDLLATKDENIMYEEKQEKVAENQGIEDIDELSWS